MYIHQNCRDFTLGPAAYSPSKEKLSRKRGYYGCAKSAFNSTAVRKIDFVTKDTLCMPGPANYIVEPLVKPQLNVSGCHFRSTTERFPDIVQSVSTYNNVML